MTSTQRTVLVIAVAAAAVIGAGLYFAPKKAGDNAAGTVAPAARQKAEGAAGSPSAASGAPPQAGPHMDASAGKSQGSDPNAAAASPKKDQSQGGYSVASDRRLKSNIVRIGTHPLGIGLYEYDIFGERQRGVMADEVEQVMPEAVITHSTLGYKMVRYDLLSRQSLFQPPSGPSPAPTE